MIAPDRLALGIEPNSSLSVLDMMECAQLAEKKGFAATWVAEGRRGEVFALLSALAMGTSRMRLGAGILPVLIRSPWVVASGAATVDEVSGGRFMLGLGAGHKSVIEDRYGLAYDRPTLRMREVTDIVRRALTSEPVSVQGEIFRLSGAQLSRRPVRGEVPIYIAGTGPRVLELAGEIADGAFLMFPTENSLRTSLRHIGDGARRANRDPGELDVIAYVFTCVAAERRVAIEVIAPYDRIFRPAASLSQPFCSGRIFSRGGTAQGRLGAERRSAGDARSHRRDGVDPKCHGDTR